MWQHMRSTYVAARMPHHEPVNLPYGTDCRELINRVCVALCRTPEDRHIFGGDGLKGARREFLVRTVYQRRYVQGQKRFALLRGVRQDVSMREDLFGSPTAVLYLMYIVLRIVVLLKELWDDD